MPSSAVASNINGTERPSASAVLRLITRSNLSGRCIWEVTGLGAVPDPLLARFCASGAEAKGPPARSVQFRTPRPAPGMIAPCFERVLRVGSRRGDRVRRRDFVAVFGGGFAAATPLSVCAQRAMPAVGVLGLGVSTADPAPASPASS